MEEEQFAALVAAINENTRFLNILAELLTTVEKRLATIEGNVRRSPASSPTIRPCRNPARSRRASRVAGATR